MVDEEQGFLEDELAIDDEENDSSAVGVWKDGLCSCTTNVAPSCGMSFCCQCVMAGQIAQKLYETGTEDVNVLTIRSLNIPMLSSCNSLGPFHSVVGSYMFVLLIAYLCGTSWVFTLVLHGILIFSTYTLRRVMRHRYNIAGSWIEDILLAICCRPCTLAQMARHIFHYRSRCEHCSCEINGEVTRRNL